MEIRFLRKYPLFIINRGVLIFLVLISDIGNACKRMAGRFDNIIVAVVWSVDWLVGQVIGRTRWRETSENKNTMNIIDDWITSPRFYMSRDHHHVQLSDSLRFRH